MLLGTLHYIYDPLCGWCYGAAPLLEAAASVPGLQIRLHAGGMMAGVRRQAASADLRAFVKQHIRRITQLTGQEFGKPYEDGLLADPANVLDSGPPATAILAAAEFGLDKEMLAKMQEAHFVHGRQIADRQVLRELAAELGLAAFEQTFDRLSGAATEQHIEASRNLLSKVGGAGFPTYAYESPTGWKLLNNSEYLGRPEQWAQALAALP